MKVFLSSVTLGLKDERDGLAALLSVSREYVPLRFEDFMAQDRSSRDACLSGVRASDAYVLLLGAHYGQPFPDSGLAPTEEEFQLAKNLGKPILAFVKNTDEPVEPAQAGFRGRVQDYVEGRFRDSFRTIAELNVAVYGALEALPRAAPTLEWTPATSPVEVSWLQTLNRHMPTPQYVPLLQVALVPPERRAMRASELEALPRLLAREGRSTEFFNDLDGLAAGSSEAAAWVAVPQSNKRSTSWSERRENSFRGLVRFRSGEALAFSAIPTDNMGALVDQADLTRRSSALLRNAPLPDLGVDAAVVVAARLGPLDFLREGDPTLIGHRNTGQMGTRPGEEAEMSPRDSVPAGAIRTQSADVGAEIASELLRAVRRPRW